MSCACGPGWVPSRLVHWHLKIPKGETCFFHEACEEHDNNYALGVPRDYSDQKFLLDMVNIAQRDEVTFEELSMAIRYFQWVRYGGWVSYNIARVSRVVKGFRS